MTKAAVNYGSTKSPRSQVQVRRRRFRIGVLPFLPHRVPDDEDFAITISEVIAAELTRCSSWEVISPKDLMHRTVTSLTDDGEKQAGQLDYILEGVVSTEGRRAHLNMRVLDLGECARTVWNERTIINVSKLRRWSRLAAARITGGIDPVTLFFEGRPTQRNRTGANGLLFIAIPLMSSLERRKYEEAGRLISRAVEIEPDNAMAAAWAAFWQVIYFGQGWTQNFLKAWAIAQDRARRALSLKPADAETLAMCGHVTSFLGKDYDAALDYFDRARRLDPTREFPWLWSALTYCYAGRPGLALERLEQYRALTSISPANPWTQNICSVAYMFSGNYEKAVEFSRPMIQVSPNFVNAYKPLIASLGHLGRVEEAKPYVDKLLALEPNFSLERFAKVYPIKYDSDREHYMKGLRLAGIPER